MSKIIYFFAFALLLCAVLSLCSCSRKVYVPVEKTITEKVTVQDTVVDVRLEPSHDSISVNDTISHLNNKYAESWAKYISGQLHHSLTIKATTIPVHVQVVHRDKIIFEPKIYTVDKIVYKDKVLTWLERIRMTTGDIALILLIIWLIFKRRK